MAATLTLRVQVNDSSLKTLENKLKTLTGKQHIVTVKVEAKTESLRTLETRIKALEKAHGVNVKVNTNEGKLKTLEGRLKAVQKDHTAKVNVQADTSKLEPFEARIKELEKPRTVNIGVNAQQLDNTANTMGKMNSITKDTTRSVSDLGTAITSKIKWSAIQGAINGVASAFANAVQEMQKVDTELTNIRKVTGQSKEDVKWLEDTAYETASRYGILASEYMAAVYEYTKAGFADTADEMAELSTKTMLVGDTTQEVADKFLIAGDKAFGFGGNIEQLSMLVDQADYINNNYATTLDKLAEGFPRVASVASMAGMTAEETMAMLGTITATTQETASRAATASRALILNILGDTTEEVEEGVTVTKDQINGLRDALNKYAPDVVKAAEATGDLINPMKALDALATAYEKHDLTKSGLAQIEMALGGKLRVNQLDALLKQWGTYKEMLEGMGTAAGTADAEVSTMLDSWEAKTKILSNTWTEFVAKTLKSDFFKGVIEGLTKVLDLYGNLGNMLATTGGVLASIKAFKKAISLGNVAKEMAQDFSAAKNAIYQYTREVSSVTQQMQLLAQNGQQNSAEYQKLSAQLETLKGSYAGLKNNLELTKEEYRKATIQANTFNMVALGITAVTAAFTTTIMLYNKFTQEQQEVVDGLIEESKAFRESAESAQSEIATLEELYEAYQETEALHEKGLATSQELNSASAALKDAMGIEKGAVVDLTGAYEDLIAKKREDMQTSAEQAVLKAKQALQEKTQGMPDYAWDLAKVWGNPASRMAASGWQKTLSERFDTDEEIDALIDAYKRAIEYRDALDKKAAGKIDFFTNLAKSAPEAKKKYDDAVKVIDEWAETLDPLIAAQETLNDVMNGTADAAEGVADSPLAESLNEVTDAAEDAKTALEEYQEAIKEMKGDDYKELNKAVENALKDIEKGLKDSTYISALADLLFSPEAIAEAKKNGKSKADLIASSFMKEFAGYLDEDGVWQATGGEDMGAKFLEALWGASGEEFFNGWTSEMDDLGNRIIKKGDEIAASIHLDEETGQIDWLIEDYELLAEALGWSAEGIEIIRDALSAWNEGLNMSETEIKKFAKEAGALGADDAIALEPFITALQEAGVELDEALEYVDKINESDKLKFTVDYGDVETAKEHVRELYDDVAEVSEASEDTNTDFDLSGVDSAIEKTDKKTQRLINTAQKAYEEFVKFGNIDLSDREVQINEDGSHSTVKGGSMGFGIGDQVITIAYSPMLQTGTGQPEELTSEAVASYLHGILDAALKDGEWTVEEIFKLDDKGLIADVDATLEEADNTAISVGDHMHVVCELLERMGKINFDTTDVVKLTEQIGYIKQYMDELNNNENISVDVKAEQLENAETILAGLEARLKSIRDGSADATVTVDSNTENATDGMEEVTEEADDVDELAPEVTVDANITPAQQKLSQIVSVLSALTSTTHKIRIDVQQTPFKGIEADAEGTEGSSGGMALVNDGNGPELIVEDGQARIAGGGKPVITVLQKDAKVFNAEQTKDILQRSGVPAYDQGTSQRYTPPASDSNDKSKSSDSSQGFRQTGTTTTTTDETLEALKSGVELAKSWLEYSKAIYEYCGDINEGYARQKELTEQVAAAILEQAHYLEQTGGDQAEINKLYAEYFAMLKEADELAKKELEEKQSLLKSELELMEAQDRPLSERQAKEQEIVDNLEEQIALLETMGGHEEEINRLLKEKLELEQDIKDMAVEEAEGEVSLLKSQLDVLEAKDAPLRKQIAKQREIQAALKAQIAAMKAAKAPAEEINKVRAELYQIEQDIKDEEQELYDRVIAAAERKIDKINEKRDAELEKLKAARDAKKEQNELEAKELALAEAKERLANARAERNVRVWNAAKGQWEWVANAQDVEAAEKEVQSAQDDIDEYYEEKEYEAAEAAINEKYDKLIEPWQKVIDELTEPAESLGHALKALGENATEAMYSTIQALSKILQGTGYSISTPNLWLDVPEYDSGGILKGLGGIKATKEDEMVLPPELTKAMLNPKADSIFKDRVNELNMLYGAGATQDMKKKATTSVGEQINGDVYKFGDVSLSEAEAQRTTVYELAKMSRELKSYVATAR